MNRSNYRQRRHRQHILWRMLGRKPWECLWCRAWSSRQGCQRCAEMGAMMGAMRGAMMVTEMWVLSGMSGWWWELGFEKRPFAMEWVLTRQAWMLCCCRQPGQQQPQRARDRGQHSGHSGRSETAGQRAPRAREVRMQRPAKVGGEKRVRVARFRGQQDCHYWHRP